MNRLKCEWNGWMTRLQKKGFSLVEVMVGMAIFAVVFTGIFLAYGQSVRMLDGLRQTARGEDIAMANIEFVRTRTWDQISGYTVTSPSSTISQSSSNLIESISAVATNSPVCSHLELISDDPLRIGLKNATRDIIITHDATEPSNKVQVTVNISWETMEGRRLTNSMASLITKGGMTAFTLGSGTYAPTSSSGSSSSSSGSSTSSSTSTSSGSSTSSSTTSTSSGGETSSSTSTSTSSGGDTSSSTSTSTSSGGDTSSSTSTSSTSTSSTSTSSGGDTSSSSSNGNSNGNSSSSSSSSSSSGNSSSSSGNSGKFK